MKVALNYRSGKLSNRLKMALDEKLAHLPRYFSGEASVIKVGVEFNRSTHHKTGRVVVCEITIFAHKDILRSGEHGANDLEAFDRAFASIKNQAERHSRRHKLAKYAARLFKRERRNLP